MDRLIIHIGLHKTGTTFLQTKLFPTFTKCQVVRGFHTHRSLISNYLDKNVILSDEGLSGNLWNGSYEEDFKHNIQGIKKMYKRPKIIFGIRKQELWIPSVYKQFLHEKGFKPMEYLFNKENTGILKKEELLLAPKIALLQENFDDVFIYNQRSLFKRREDFIQAVIQFIGDEEVQAGRIGKLKKQNVGVKTNFQIKTLRKLNHFNHYIEKIHPVLSLYSPALKKLKLTPRHLCQGALRKFPSAKFTPPSDLIHFIEEYYREDWDKASSSISY